MQQFIVQPAPTIYRTFVQGAIVDLCVKCLEISCKQTSP